MPSVDPEENTQQWVRENIVDALLALADPERKKDHRDAAWLVVECIVLGQIGAAKELLHLHNVEKHGAAPDVLDPTYGWRPARNMEEEPMPETKSMTILLNVSPEAHAMLCELGKHMGYRTPQNVLGYLVNSIVAGVRRPGSWERGVVVQLFGEGVYEAEKHIPEQYNGPPYRESPEADRDDDFYLQLPDGTDVLIQATNVESLLVRFVLIDQPSVRAELAQELRKLADELDPPEPRRPGPLTGL